VASRLTELLERIRPAGAPGAAATGVRMADEARAAEIEHVWELLAEYEAEADDVIAGATAEAAAMRRRADREVESIRARIADRVAIAEAEATQRQERRGAAAASEVHEQARREAQRRRAAAAARMDELVDAAIRSIWEVADAEGEVGP